MTRQQERDNLDRLIQLRDSEIPEERAQFNRLVGSRPTMRIAIGYYEAEQQGTAQA
ncbi:hypothetical protein [Microbacterium sp. 22296]|uniref:hypothetical protein n=1 Tax=Microbacterium sp. 22296 TaxID=3453903 RepID=UPI003F86BD7A